MKIVINDCYGGFGLSDDAFKIYLERKGIKYITEICSWSARQCIFYEDTGTETKGKHLWDRGIDRSDEVLVQLVEELGENVNGWASALKVVEIPDDVEWQIEEYDGNEWVAEKHRTWR